MKRKFSQRKFVEKAADTISFAYAGINDGYPGFASAIYSDGEPDIIFVHLPKANGF